MTRRDLLAAALVPTAVHKQPPVRSAFPGEDWPSFLGPRFNATSSETNLRSALPAPLLWEYPKGTGYASPAVAGGRAVCFHRMADQETVDCLDSETGRRLWRRQYPSSFEDRYGYNNGPRSSPVIHRDLVYTIGAEASPSLLAPL